MKPHEIIEVIERTAYPEGAADWDNCGVQVAGRRKSVKRIAVALDPTIDIIERALDLDAHFILTHHPLSMKPKSLNVVDDHFRTVAALIENHTWLYSAHTSLDANPDGPVGWLARDLSLRNTRTLEPTLIRQREAFAFYYSGNTPEAMLEQWGELDGVAAIRHTAPLISVTCEPYACERIKAAIATDLGEVPVFLPAKPEQGPTTLGFGLIGHLPDPVDFGSFCDEMAELINRDFWTVSGPVPGTVSTVAYCTGSGSGLAPKAFALGADVFLTGDVKYHTALDSTGCLIDVGHFSLEEEMMRRFSLRLAEELTGVEIFFLPAEDPFSLRRALS